MRRSGFAMGLALGVAGCSHSPPTQFYVLAPSAPASQIAKPYRGAPIRIATVDFPPEFDRPELIDNRSRSELIVLDFAHWAAPIGALARQTLTEDLAARLPPGQVVDSNASNLPHRDIDVAILVLRREGAATNLELTWTLSPRRGEPSAAGSTQPAGPAIQAALSAGAGHSESHTLQMSEPSTASGPQDQADVVGRLLARTADHIALTLAQSDPATERAP